MKQLATTPPWQIQTKTFLRDPYPFWSRRFIIPIEIYGIHLLFGEFQLQHAATGQYLLDT
jgi:hypothetical protein